MVTKVYEMSGYVKYNNAKIWAISGIAGVISRYPMV